jgi:poly-D-alanine transfer protein DltD
MAQLNESEQLKNEQEIAKAARQKQEQEKAWEKFKEAVKMMVKLPELPKGDDPIKEALLSFVQILSNSIESTGKLISSGSSVIQDLQEKVFSRLKEGDKSTWESLKNLFKEKSTQQTSINILNTKNEDLNSRLSQNNSASSDVEKNGRDLSLNTSNPKITQSR